jgi:hypothetical protein
VLRGLRTYFWALQKINLGPHPHCSILDPPRSARAYTARNINIKYKRGTPHIHVHFEDCGTESYNKIGRI